MPFEETVDRYDAQQGTDATAFLSSIMMIDLDDAVAIAALRPFAMATAMPIVRPGSAISVARTYHGMADAHATQLRCPSDSSLITIALSDAAVSIANGNRTLNDGMLRKGMAFVTAPGERLLMKLEGECDLLHLAVPTSVMTRLTAQRRDLHDFAVSDPLFRRIGRLLCEGPAPWLEAYADLLCQIAVARLLQLAPILPVSGLPKWRLMKVETFVNENIDTPLRLSDLATAAGLSRMHFAAQFRMATGHRPHAYVLARRIARAKAMMVHTEMSLVRVALEAGFQSQAHFCTIFKRLTGITPSAWQRAQLENAARPTGRVGERVSESAAFAALEALLSPVGTPALRPATPSGLLNVPQPLTT